jgi:hypothetical protein
MTSYTDTLFAIAQGKPVTTVTSPPTDITDAGSWLCCFWKELAEALADPLFAPTRHGIDAVVDELYRHPVFQETLSHAADINEHFALSYLPATPPAFQALWHHVVLPATHHHATVHRLVSSSTEHTNC